MEANALTEGGTQRNCRPRAGYFVARGASGDVTSKRPEVTT